MQLLLIALLGPVGWLIGFNVGWLITNRRDPWNWRVCVGPTRYFRWLDSTKPDWYRH